MNHHNASHAGSAAPDPSDDLGHQLAHAADEMARLVEEALQLPEPAASWWHRPGVSPRGERWLEVVSSLVLLTLAAAWVWSLVTQRATLMGGEAGGEVVAGVSPTTRAVTAALTTADAPSTAFLADAALEAFAPLRGASGKVRVVLQAPGDSLPSSLPAGATVRYAPDGAVADTVASPEETGIYHLAVQVGRAVREVAELDVITLTPLSERRGGRIGKYFIGRWPTEGRRAAAGAAARGNYEAPRGLIEVTPANQDTRVSEHLRLRDFLTHDQQNVWPKYVVVQTRLVDKLELVLADLAARGVSPEGIHVMSGFRTPQYNAGGGDPRGRAGLSRHMYGDAADIWIDNDGNGRMDDLNRDGRIDLKDAAFISAAVDRVEQAHPELVGGAGIYPSASNHGPFTHIDARGYRARWLGSGDGG